MPSSSYSLRPKKKSSIDESEFLMLPYKKGKSKVLQEISNVLDKQFEEELVKTPLSKTISEIFEKHLVKNKDLKRFDLVSS